MGTGRAGAARGGPPGRARKKQGEELLRLRAEEAEQPFDLAAGPLLRLLLLRLGEREHALLLTQHHIASDGWSIGILVREIGTLYQAFAAGRPSSLPELPIQYADFAVWQRSWLSGEVLAAELGYWRERLAGAPALSSFPTDRPRRPLARLRGQSAEVLFDEELVSVSRRAVGARG